MADKGGCTNYISRTVTINFTNDGVCCARCPLLQTYSRNQCMRTGELIADTRGVGGWCPLTDPETGYVEGQYY